MTHARGYPHEMVGDPDRGHWALKTMGARQYGVMGHQHPGAESDLHDLRRLLSSSAARSLRISHGTSLDDRLRICSDRAVLRILGSRLVTVASRLVTRVMSVPRNACRPSSVAGGVIADLTRSRGELIAENAFLRQQLIVASRGAKRPSFRGHERGLLVLVARFLPRSQRARLLVKPETVLRWHREGFRLFWRRKSRSTVPRESRLAPDVIALIQRMAAESRLWG